MKDVNVYKRGLMLIGLLLLLGTQVYSQDSNFHIYLCFGQSNMQGNAPLEEFDMTVDTSFKVLQAVDCAGLQREKGSWYTAVPPLCRCYTGLTPADYFGRTMVLNLPDSVRVGVINVAVAGCKIELFDKDNYQDYVSSITADWLINIINEYDGNPYGYLVDLAKMAQQDGVIKGILLHQGESNTGDKTWPSKVKAVYSNLINDLGLDADSIPLLAGEMVHADQGGVCASMNSIIASLPDTLSNSYVISSSGCTDAADNLHFDAAGYRELGKRYATTMLSIMGYDVSNLQYPEVPKIFEGNDSVFLEAECATVGEDWEILESTEASNEKYVTVKAGTQSLSEASPDSASALYFTFTVDTSFEYNVFARLNCPNYEDDSFWIKMDNGNFETVNGLVTGGWQWLNLNSYALEKGEHTLTITYREDGAKLDKLCIANFSALPTGMGGEAENICVEEEPTSGINIIKTGYKLGNSYPNPFSEKTNIAFEVPHNTYVSLKVFNMYGVEVVELAGQRYTSGKHILEFDPGDLSDGSYLYVFKTDTFFATRKMVFMAD